VRRLHLTDCDIGDEHLLHLAPLGKLMELGLSKNHVTDAGLAQLAGLTKLRTASLTKNQIGDAGLAHLAGMTGLKQLFCRIIPSRTKDLCISARSNRWKCSASPARKLPTPGCLASQI
jgi:hypothetical protein